MSFVVSEAAWEGLSKPWRDQLREDVEYIQKQLTDGERGPFVLDVGPLIRLLTLGDVSTRLADSLAMHVIYPAGRAERLLPSWADFDQLIEETKSMYDRESKTESLDDHHRIMSELETMTQQCRRPTADNLKALISTAIDELELRKTDIERQDESGDEQTARLRSVWESEIKGMVSKLQQSASSYVETGSLAYRRAGQSEDILTGGEACVHLQGLANQIRPQLSELLGERPTDGPPSMWLLRQPLEYVNGLVTSIDEFSRGIVILTESSGVPETQR